MLFDRVSALGRALVFVAGLALNALWSASAQAPIASSSEQEAVVHVAQSAIEANDALPTDDVRAGEQLQLVSSSARTAPRPPATATGLTTTAQASPNGLSSASLRWCDVIQCRRLSGAMLLGFSTPPPALS